MLEVARKLRFLNEYGELETVEAVDCVESFKKTVWKSYGAGGYWKLTLSSIVIFVFLCFFVVVEVAWKLWYLNEYGGLETFEPRDQVEVLEEKLENS